MPALMRACGTGHVAVIQALLTESKRQNADINAKADHSWSSITIAVERGHVEAVKVLIDAGADVDSRAEHGWTAIMIASEKGHVKITNLLIAAGADIHTRSVESNDDHNRSALPGGDSKADHPG